MKRLFLVSTLFLSFLFIVSSVFSQNFTMGKKCRELSAQSQSALQSGDYEGALVIFEEFSGECKTKDAKEILAVGRAEAYNNLGEYEKALEQADKAIDVSKEQSLSGYFQKGIARQNLGDVTGSKESLQHVIELTEMNENTQERAQNYALMAALYDRQLGERDSAMMYLDKAKELDSNNPNFWIQEGDMFIVSDEFYRAFESYDQAMALGKKDMEMYQIRSDARLKQMDSKYGTTKANELRDKMTDEEKRALCADLTTALDMGLKDMNKDMFAAMICK